MEDEVKQPTYRVGFTVENFKVAADKMYHFYSSNGINHPGGGLRAAAEVGRTLLNSGDPWSAEQVFLHLLSKISQTDNPEQYILIGNLAYALTDQGRYSAAIDQLNILKKRGGDQFHVWHKIALAYAHFKRDIGDDKGYAIRLIGEIKQDHQFSDQNDQEFWQRIYPDIKELLEITEIR